MHRLAEPFLGALRRQLLREPGDVRQAFADGVLVQLARVGHRLGALLVGVPEDADGVQPGLGEEALQLGEVRLGLAGEADDEVGPRAGLRGPGADRAEQFQEAVGVPEAAHRAQHAGRRVLEGQVEVGGDLGRGGEDVDQAGTHLGGLQIADPDPLDAVDLRELRQQRLQQPDVAQVLAVGGVVLGDQHDLLDALSGEPAGLPQHIRGAAGDEGAAEGGDGAERAAPVAAGGQLDGRHGAVVQAAAERCARPGGGRDPRGQILRHGYRGRSVAGQRHLGALPLGGADGQQLPAVPWGVRGVDAAGEDGLQAVGDVGVVVKAEDAVGLGQRRGELLAVPLGHAAHGDDGLCAGSAPGGLRLEVVGLQQGVHGVLLGGLDETAGVDDGDIRVGGLRDELPAVRRQTACELLRVHLVASAA